MRRALMILGIGTTMAVAGLAQNDNQWRAHHCNAKYGLSAGAGVGQVAIEPNRTGIAVTESRNDQILRAKFGRSNTAAGGSTSVRPSARDWARQMYLGKSGRTE